MKESRDNKDPFASLRVPEYRVLWWGGAFSFMGVQMQFLLRGLLAWDLTQREGALGIVFLVFGLSMLVFTPFGGVAADRLRRKGLLLWGQLAISMVAVGMGVVVLAGVEQFWMLCVAAAGQGAMFGLTGPARTAFANDLVGKDLIGNAVSLSMLSMSTTRIFAPSLAGALAGVAAFGIGGAYLVAASFSLISFFFTLRLPNPAPSATLPKRSPLADIADGIAYVRANPSLRRLVITSTVVIMFGFNYIAFMPALVEGVFDRGKGSVGLVSTASSIGAVAIAIPIAARANSPRVRQILSVSGVSFGLTVMLLAGAPTYWIAFLVTIFIGASTTGFQAVANGIAMTSSDASHHGRVQSLMNLSFAGFGIVAAPLGLLAEVIGLRWTIAVMGAVAALATVVYAIAERVWRLPQLPATVQPARIVAARST